MSGKKKIILMKGDKFNHLQFMSEYFILSKTTGHKIRCAICECECGTIINVLVNNLIVGKPKSCGCKRTSSIVPTRIVHGMAHTRIYSIWNAMKKRCSAKKGYNFKYYGSKGITVCAEWQNNFDLFYQWSMANGYTDELTLDRMENDKGYSPDNCRWVNMTVQSNNRSSNVFFEYGDQRKTITDWARDKGINRHTLYKRVVIMGWSLEDSLQMPISKLHSQNSNSKRVN